MAPAGTSRQLVDLAAALRSVGLEAGLYTVGVASADSFDSTRQHLEQRKRLGLHGGMHFTYANPRRSTDPALALPGARALVVGARSYLRAGVPPQPAGAGAVARYSWEDHYELLRSGLGAMADRLTREGWKARVLVDDNALVDREAAYRAGLGWYGKNTNLLLPGHGSWFVLGSVVTDAPLPTRAERVEDGCGACSRCLPACPTGALVAPGVLDARRCLAWLLEAPGTFPKEHRVALGGRIYGCDDCQEVCPPNRVELRRGAPPAGSGAQPWVDLVAILEATDEELLGRFGRWYIPRRQPRYIRRNALVALGNVGDGSAPDIEAALVRSLASADAVVRGHAVWAAARLARNDLLAAIAADEHDAGVLAELEDAGVRRRSSAAAAAAPPAPAPPA